MVAENDLAFGHHRGHQRSKFWPQTAIFVVGRRAKRPRSVDAHRTIAFVVSPSQAAPRFPHVFDEQHFATMELVLGLKRCAV